MSGASQKRFWKSLPQRDADPNFQQAADEFAGVPGAEVADIHRRAFLKAAGFAFAGLTLAGCQKGPLPRAPVRHALPFAIQPEDMVPGHSVYYASTCAGCPAGCGILAKTRDGRPIKLEGNPEHPLNRGGLCAAGQASLLGLYDRQRLQGPHKNGQPITWEQADREIQERLAEIRNRDEAVRFLSGTITSPTTQALIHQFLHRFSDGQHVVHDGVSSAAIIEAHEKTHGVGVLPRYYFERAETIVGFDADFLGTWISPVEFTRGYSAGRSLDGRPPRMSFHVQFEARLSLTGSKADERVRLAPNEMGLVLTELAARIARRAGIRFETPVGNPPVVASEFLDRLVDRLWQTRTKSLVVCGSQDLALQKLTNFLNHMLENYGHTLDLERPSLQRRGAADDLDALLQDLNEGSVAALFILDCNPLFELPDTEGLAAALGKVPLIVYLGQRMDETAKVAHYICPPPHFLACWSDAEPVHGVAAILQPTVQLREDTRPVIESLAAWMGQPRPALTIVRDHWQGNFFNRQDRFRDFQVFWDQTVHDGFALIEPVSVKPLPFAVQEVAPVTEGGRLADGHWQLVLYPTVGMADGRNAYNPWLHELPDPLTKTTWDNYACVSPEAASRLAVREGDVVRLESVGRTGTPQSIELPVLVQPGHHNDVVAVPLGYGSTLSARFASIGPSWLEGRPTVGDNGLVGTNAAPLSLLDKGHQIYTRVVRISRTDRKHPLACTQMHQTITVPPGLAPPGHTRRPIIQEMTLAEFARQGEAPTGQGHPPDLWPEDHPTTGPRWGMVIDLHACTGCSACVIACQAENNIPVVGKDEVLRQREMHWLRIDRYYSGSDDAIDVAFQPMMCQHCGNAPCETVCPVLATVHSEEGLNQQVYNRCVGTRYCANNCPYKVRRFNWFDYSHEDALQNLVLNPDVTVRSRGVMEKCSLCVQRIQEAKHDARGRDELLRDGAIQTACQQSCPARAIVFGDLNNPQSRAAQMMGDRRRYQVLAELNVRPAVGYLGLVRNRPGTEVANDG
jgi:MoCo/4Fe-4S cofactor protein with predicted Tat translocation signal